MFALFVSTILAGVIAVFYLYSKYAYSYWKRKGVPFAKPSIPFGNFGPVFMRIRSFGQNLHDLYYSSNEPVLGIFTVFRPTLLVRDPKITNNILIKDFQYFWHRGFHFDDKNDPLALNLFTKSGKQWREMRNKLSPAFTSGKLKGMVETIADCNKKLEDCLNQYVVSGEEAEVHELFAQFTTNVIASVGFGLEIDCFKHPDNDFRKYSRRGFEPLFRNTFRPCISFASPFLTKLLGIRSTDKDVQDYMTETVRQNLEYRESNNISRKDFFQLLIQLRNAGKVQDDDDDWDTKATNNPKTLTLDEITAHTFQFMFAGHESSSTTMTFCMYELAKNQTIQQKVYEEIKTVLQKYNGKLTYEALNEMKYLDCCIDETLRLHPPFDAILRECTKDYQIADTDIVIEKGTPVLFSVTGPQTDPEYYDQPLEFIPERFLEIQNVNKNSAATPYLAFGDGPRNCIGLRLGKMQTKIGLSLLLRKFSFELGAQFANNALVLDPDYIARASVNGMHLKVKSRC